MATGLAAFYPTVARHRAERAAAARLDRIVESRGDRGEGGAGGVATAIATPRVSRLGSLLASWETIGGCGAGGSGSGGATIKWIGRNTHGGLFQVVQMFGFLYLYEDPSSTDFRGGYNLVSSTQISKDFSEKWGGGVIVPVTYKYYRNFAYSPNSQPYDLSNGGVGDPSLLVIRKFGAINDTIATLNVGIPGKYLGISTGRYQDKNPQTFGDLTQEKQIGFGRPTASLTLDHVFDEIWGLFLVGGSASYRGGTNDMESYRAPSASAYAHVGYFAGPFVPAAGLTATGFTAHDRDKSETQATPLFTLAPSVSVEWSNDYVALIAGAQFPFGTSFTGQYSKLPWVAAVGVSISPF
ncbi:MAG TPA: hypothetical protein VMU50_16885 [Polyangia bacterium]|nr:hypothetical protein [Polyangia bacterium]